MSLLPPSFASSACFGSTVDFFEQPTAVAKLAGNWFPLLFSSFLVEGCVRSILKKLKKLSIGVMFPSPIALLAADEFTLFLNELLSLTNSAWNHYAKGVDLLKILSSFPFGLLLGVYLLLELFILAIDPTILLSLMPVFFYGRLDLIVENKSSNKGDEPHRNSYEDSAPAGTSLGGWPINSHSSENLTHTLRDRNLNPQGI